MANVLVLIELSRDGAIADSAAPLLKAAADVGTPVAVVTASPRATDVLVPELGALGAAHVHIAESEAARAGLVGPLVAALDQAAAHYEPTLVLVPYSVDAREAGARFAVRAGAGLALDAVRVRVEGERVVTAHSVFGGDYEVD